LIGKKGQSCSPRRRRRSFASGCAPDTFLGAGIQTARKLIDDRLIGKPVSFTAFMMGRGHEHWHPSPEFYYEKGGGPMFDMGPYYLTALLNLLGPVNRVTGFTSMSRPTRTIVHKDGESKRGPKYGKPINVETADHYVGAMEFAGGAVGTIIQSFAMRAAEYDRGNPIHIFGTDGAIKVPDPNQFDGKVLFVPIQRGEGRVLSKSAHVAGRLRAVDRIGGHGGGDPKEPAAPMQRRAGVCGARSDAGVR
jgi:predicted dehydrogenase